MTRRGENKLDGDFKMAEWKFKVGSYTHKAVVYHVVEEDRPTYMAVIKHDPKDKSSLGGFGSKSTKFNHTKTILRSDSLKELQQDIADFFDERLDVQWKKYIAVEAGHFRSSGLSNECSWHSGSAEFRAFDLEIGEESFLVASDNSVIKAMASTRFSVVHNRKPASIEELNDFLKSLSDKDALWLQVTKTPSEKPASAGLRRLDGLVKGSNGDTSFFNGIDIEYMLQADFDGDTINT